MRRKLLGGVGHRHFAIGVGEGLPEGVFEGEVVGELGAPASGAQAVAEGGVRHRRKREDGEDEEERVL